MEAVLEQYFWECSLSMSCREVAFVGGSLSWGGVLDDAPLLSPSHAKRINVVMLTCGTYDAAGEFAYRVGRARKERSGRGFWPSSLTAAPICVWCPS